MNIEIHVLVDGKEVELSQLFRDVLERKIRKRAKKAWRAPPVPPANDA